MSGLTRYSLVTVLFVALTVTACGGEDPPTADTRIDAEPVPVVLDGDFGPDDMMALLYLLGRPDVEVQAVTVSGTGLVHCPDGAANATAILRYLGYDDIPVACGAPEPVEGSNAFPEEWRSGSDALAVDLGIEPIGETSDEGAVELLTETISRSNRPVRLLVLGPLTNVAMALEADPRLTDGLADITIMGGALRVNGSVAPDYQAEWNIWVDPAAASRVLTSGVPVRLVPLDATNDVPATSFFYRTLDEARETPGAELVYHFFETRPYNLEGGSYFFWDPLAAVALTAPDVVTFEDVEVAIDQVTGETIESDSGVAIEVATSADRQAFESEFLSTLNAGKPVTPDIPEPDVSITYSGDGCTWEGSSDFETTGVSSEVIVELVNETEMSFAIVAGTHDGVPWEQVQADAATYQQTEPPPSYWIQTGTLGIYGRSITGGETTGTLDLAPGTYALICSDTSNRLWPLTDVVVSQ